ncbi:MAG: SpoIID/LytB domain-containing protein [Leptospirales bacterium]|nr:SpoIID/LytB domain-containing protein [Leptospirales bacterium]
MRIKVSYKISIILFIIGLMLNGCTPSERYLRGRNLKQEDSPIYVKILIGIKDKNFKVNSETGLRVINKNDSKIIYESNKSGLSFDPIKIKSIYVVESDKNILYIDNIGYRGKIELHNILGKIHVVNILDIEEYLYSVVPSEMPSSWNIEALKSQAIASRTYAYYFLLRTKDENIYELDSTTNFQVYKGISVETESSIEAVNKTSGIIMTYNNEPIISYFHSTSGGKTSDDSDVWPGSDLPYLKSVECSYGKDSPHYEWTITLSMNEITSALNKKYKTIDHISKILFKRHNDRIVEVTVQHKNGTITLTGNEFRLLLDPQKLKSTYFTIKKEKDIFFITGKGWGHGIGMCQWGAKGRGENGFKYEDILKHYYKGVNFTKINNNYLARK